MFHPVGSSQSNHPASVPLPAVDEKEKEETEGVSTVELTVKEKEEAAKVKQEVVIEEQEVEDEETIKLKGIGLRYLEKLGLDPFFDDLPFKEAAIFYLVDLYHKLEKAQKTPHHTPLNHETHILFLTLITQLHGNQNLDSQNLESFKTFFNKLEACLVNRSKFYKEFKAKCTCLQFFLSQSIFEGITVCSLKGNKEESTFLQKTELLRYITRQLFVINKFLSVLMKQVQANELMQPDHPSSFSIVKSRVLNKATQGSNWQSSVTEIGGYIRLYRDNILFHLKRMQRNVEQGRVDLFHLACSQLPKTPSILLLEKITAHIKDVEEVLNIAPCIPLEKQRQIENEEGVFIKKSKRAKKEADSGQRDLGRLLNKISSYGLSLDDHPEMADFVKGFEISNAYKAREASVIEQQEKHEGEVLRAIIRRHIKTEKLNKKQVGELHAAFGLIYRYAYRLCVELSLVESTLTFFDASLHFCSDMTCLMERPQLSEEEVDALWLLNDRALSSRPVKTRKKKASETDQAPLKEKEKSPPPSLQKERSKEKEVPVDAAPYFSSHIGILRQPLRLHFSSSASQEHKRDGHLCRQDAWYHLQVFALSVDLYAEMKRTKQFVHWQAILHRFIRGASVGLEETITSQALALETPIKVNHDFVTGIQESVLWEGLSEEDRKFLEAINLGTVFHRYPHKTARRFFTQQGLSLPKALVWLLNPKKGSHRELDPFIHSTIASLESLTRQTYPMLHKTVDQNDAVKGKQSCKKESVFLKKNLRSSLDSIASLSKQVEQFSKEASTERKSENWKEVMFILSSLQKQLNCWMAYPQPVYLASHVDMILTLLQFLDEQTGLALYDEKLDQRFFTHDLGFYGVALEEGETPERQRVNAQLNIHTGGQYPHRYLSSLSSEEKTAVDPASAVRLRLDALHISQHTDREGKVWTPSTGHEAVSSYEEITQKLVSLVNDCMAVTQKRFNNSYSK